MLGHIARGLLVRHRHLRVRLRVVVIGGRLLNRSRAVIIVI